MLIHGFVGASRVEGPRPKRGGLLPVISLEPPFCLGPEKPPLGQR